jgi:hypothetical protein
LPDAAAIARMYRQRARVELAVFRILAALARLGLVHSADGKSLAIRRAAQHRPYAADFSTLFTKALRASLEPCAAFLCQFQLSG